MERLAWTLALPLAVFGLIVVFTDWIDWPWWIGFLLGAPVFFLAMWGSVRPENRSGDYSPGSEVGGDGGGGGNGG